MTKPQGNNAQRGERRRLGKEGASSPLRSPPEEESENRGDPVSVGSPSIEGPIDAVAQRSREDDVPALPKLYEGAPSPLLRGEGRGEGCVVQTLNPREGSP